MCLLKAAFCLTDGRLLGAALASPVSRPRLGHPAPVQGLGWAADRRHAAVCWLHVWIMVVSWENVHSCLLQCPFGFPGVFTWGGDGSEATFVLRGSRMSATHPGGRCAKAHRPSIHEWTWLVPTHLRTPKLEFHILLRVTKYYSLLLFSPLCINMRVILSFHTIQNRKSAFAPVPIEKDQLSPSWRWRPPGHWCYGGRTLPLPGRSRGLW